MKMKFQHITTSIALSLYVILTIFLMELPHTALSQEPLFELPVQLVGFPVIILSVRLANFAKKLAYSINPSTYRSRSRRDLLGDGFDFSKAAIDSSLAEKKILKEFGPKACVLEAPCKMHASRTGPRGAQPDWDDILENYKVQSTGMKQWYLLSVFLGDVIRDVPLCKQLAKRLDCNRSQEQFTRD